MLDEYNRKFKSGGSKREAKLNTQNIAHYCKAKLEKRGFLVSTIVNATSEKKVYVTHHYIKMIHCKKKNKKKTEVPEAELGH